jgi:HlyD family secretion protein
VNDRSPVIQHDVAADLDVAASSRTQRRRWRLLAAIGVLVAAGAIGAWLLPAEKAPLQYRKAQVERGDLTVVVTATGTLQPTNQVDVGSELSGIVRTVAVDYNDTVRVGQVLARLDTTRLAAQVLQSEAALRSAQAKVREADANDDEMRRKLARANELFTNKFVSEEALVTAKAAADRATASVDSARGAVEQARAALAMDRTNLEKSVIRSPINGTVLARKVEPGQTVAAALQAPVLFTLAEDLTKMELHVDVDEADIGEVKAGEKAAFTVAAYPGVDFPSQVADVRNAAKTVNGVVTYETVLAVDNAKLLLRPGMTGTANITVAHLVDVVLVPNAALRFVPPVPAVAEQRSFVSRLLPIPPRPASTADKSAADRRHQRVWVLKDGAPAAIAIAVGASDGRMTAVVDGKLAPGTEVLTDVVASPP